MTQVINSKKYSVLFDRKQNCQFSVDDFKITRELVANASFENHLLNTREFSQSPDVYNPVLPGIYVIPPRSRWNFDLNSPSLASIKMAPQSYESEAPPANLDRIIKKYKNLIDPQYLVFEVSGGLDTSLIISVYTGEDKTCKQVGVVSDRYEFRTERAIQEYYFDRASSHIKINEDSALPFSKLSEVPHHPLPTKASLFFGRHSVVSQAAVELEAKYVINGIGLDPMLCNPVTGNINGFKLASHQWEDDWATLHIYRPRGLEYVNVAIRSPITSYLWKARKNEAEDPQKIWAREKFFDKLPSYLTKYRYKAAFDGVYESGLKANRSEILSVCKAAHDFAKIDAINPKNISRIMDRSDSLDQSEEIRLMASLSYAVWIYGLLRENII